VSSTRADYWLRRLRIANEEHTKTYSCMQYNEHTHATQTTGASIAELALTVSASMDTKRHAMC